MQPFPTRGVTALALALVLLPACGGGADMAAPVAPPQAEASGGAMPEESKTSAPERVFEAAPPAPSPGSVGNFMAAPAPPPPPPPPPHGTTPPAKAPDAPQPTADGAVALRAPMLIYTAQITMAVFEVSAALARVEEIGREVGGFLARRDDHGITIRVPAGRFDEAVKRVEGVGDMLHRNVAAEDVTEEFRDLEVRLRSAHAVQQRLTELLTKAVKVEESIAIERELDRVSGEIEHIEGRIKFLRDRAAFSTITVSFEPKPQEQVGKKEVRLPVPWLYDLGLRRLLSL